MNKQYNGFKNQYEKNLKYLRFGMFFFILLSKSSVYAMMTPSFAPVTSTTLAKVEKKIQRKDLVISGCQIVFKFNLEGRLNSSPQFFTFNANQIQSIIYPPEDINPFPLTMMPQNLNIIFANQAEGLSWLSDMTYYRNLCRHYHAHWTNLFSFTENYGDAKFSMEDNRCDARFRPSINAPLELLDLSRKVIGPRHGIPTSLSSHGVWPVREGLHQTAFFNGRESFYKRIEMIKSAKESIYLQTYDLFPDETTQAMAEELIAAKKRGVDVQIYLNNQMPLVKIYSNSKIMAFYSRLMAAGIPVHGFYCDLKGHLLHQTKYTLGLEGNLSKFFDGIHEKNFVVDGKEALVGGINMRNSYFAFTVKPGEDKWCDHDIFLRSPQIGADLKSAFLENVNHFSSQRGDPRNLSCFNKFPVGSMLYEKFWQSHKGRQPDSKNLVPTDVVPTFATPIRTVSAARVIRSRPQFGESHIEEFYTQAILQSKSEIWIFNPYIIPSESLIQAIRLAASRGVRVNILTIGVKFGFPDNIEALVARTYYFDFKSAHPNMVRIFEFNGEADMPGATKEMGMFHAKILFVDNRLIFMGSHNLDSISRHVNSEIGVAFRSPELIYDYKKRFLMEELRLSHEITLDEAFNFKQGNIKSLILRKHAKRL